MTDDPRERIETEHIRCDDITPTQWIIAAVGQHAPAFADWPEVVELAQKILAANEAWLDSQTPTLESLRAKYPDRRFGIDRESCGSTFCDVAFYGYSGGTHYAPHYNEAAALEWLATKLEELTDGK